MSFLWRSLVFFRRMMLKIVAVLRFCSLDSSWIPVRHLLIGTFQFAIVIFHSWLYDVFRWKVMTKQLMMMSSHYWWHHAWGLSSSWQELHLEKGLLLDWHYLLMKRRISSNFMVLRVKWHEFANYASVVTLFKMNV